MYACTIKKGMVFDPIFPLKIFLVKDFYGDRLQPVDNQRRTTDPAVYCLRFLGLALRFSTKFVDTYFFVNILDFYGTKDIYSPINNCSSAKAD
jgi:hypothetical protein